MTPIFRWKLALLLMFVVSLSTAMTTTCDEHTDCNFQNNFMAQEKDQSLLKNAVCTQDNNYDPCIDSSYIDGYCSCDSATSTITVYRGASTSQPDDYYLRYCLDEFATQGYFRYFGLKVVDFADMALEGDVLGGMKFDEVQFQNSNISTVSSIFLANSRDVTSILEMDKIVANEMPSIEANCLKELTLLFQSTEVTKIREINFRHLKEVQTLHLESNATIRVGRNAFRYLPVLQHIKLFYSVSLPYGSLAFEPSNSMQTITIGKIEEIVPGSINNLLDVGLLAYENEVGWSPAVWFNFLSIGRGTLSSRGSKSCSDCQHAWLVQGFMPAASQVRCYNPNTVPGDLGWFTPEDFSHC